MGVNIYPQEAEDVLITHPLVADAAVFGVPDAEMGEQVKAVVQPAAPAAAGSELEQVLLAHCREHLAHYKCPRSIDFEAELPRHDTGKLYKRLLRDRYWGDHGVPHRLIRVAVARRRGSRRPGRGRPASGARSRGRARPSR